jgi:hypothetical protein
VKSLTAVLQDVEDRLSEPGLDAQQKRNIKAITEGCNNVLQNLKHTINKYSELQSPHDGVGSKARRVWKRLKWEPDDIKELRDRVISNVTL